ncbi:hypothetical protein SAMN04488522_105212 [Pedobacter caeni]|uniref:Uncharacterized protein n=1 Tax=Pedobacter caeni TaxID=288992 RepID=A0A1M5J632_9SPHI|nr:hypothetical protein SAMN04488522_105212 [Pedobacter caeni]
MVVSSAYPLPFVSGTMRDYPEFIKDMKNNVYRMKGMLFTAVSIRYSDI